MRYEASDQVFVAMPFSPPFQRAYETIIRPAITTVARNGKPLQARIINRGTTGSPDIHEQIFDAIMHSRLVIADMTVQSKFTDEGGVARWQANANVAYEVGLACAWRNPEDILLIHQSHPQHAYSFDVQNLRHIAYEPANPSSVPLIRDEIINALSRSGFLANQTYLKLVQSLSPSAIHYMHQESRRAFPIVSFETEGMPIMDCRIHAATELLSCGALKNRHFIRLGVGKGVAVVCQWTELGLRLMRSIGAMNEDRGRELVEQIKSVPEGSLPPNELMTLPQPEPAQPKDTTESSQKVQEKTLDSKANKEEPESKPGVA
jgi:hypothetical protein